MCARFRSSRRSGPGVAPVDGDALEDGSVGLGAAVGSGVGPVPLVEPPVGPPVGAPVPPASPVLPVPPPVVPVAESAGPTAPGEALGAAPSLLSADVVGAALGAAVEVASGVSGPCVSRSLTSERGTSVMCVPKSAICCQSSAIWVRPASLNGPSRVTNSCVASAYVRQLTQS